MSSVIFFNLLKIYKSLVTSLKMKEAPSVPKWNEMCLSHKSKKKLQSRHRFSQIHLFLSVYLTPVKFCSSFLFLSNQCNFVSLKKILSSFNRAIHRKNEKPSNATVVIYLEIATLTSQTSGDTQNKPKVNFPSSTTGKTTPITLSSPQCSSA